MPTLDTLPTYPSLPSPPHLSPSPLQCTVSRVAPKRKGAEPAADPEEVVERAAQPAFLDATQASGLRRARGKASYVRDPIQQVGRSGACSWLTALCRTVRKVCRA